MAGTYAAVGVAAGLAGANLQATLQSPWLLGSFAALFLILASSLFGLFELRLPSALMNRLQSTGPTRSGGSRSEEHTSELQSLMRSSYAVFCLKKKKQKNKQHTEVYH